MDRIANGFINLTPAQTEVLLAHLNGEQARCSYVQLRLGVDEGQVKWSVNLDTWTPPLGEQWS